MSSKVLYLELNTIIIIRHSLGEKKTFPSLFQEEREKIHMVTQLQIVMCEYVTSDNTTISLYVILLFLTALKLSTLSTLQWDQHSNSESSQVPNLKRLSVFTSYQWRKKLDSFSSSACLQVISRCKEKKRRKRKSSKRDKEKDDGTLSLTHKTVNDTERLAYDFITGFTFPLWRLNDGRCSLT